METRPNLTPACSLLTGRNLRYFLTEALFGRGPTTVGDLVATVEQAGFTVRGRPSKTVSDALRWEVAHGRVVRLDRARYGPGRMPKQTRSWIRGRVRRLAGTAAEVATSTAGPCPSAIGSNQGSGTAGFDTGRAARPEPGTRSGRRTAAEDEVTVPAAGWSAEEEAADWDVEAALAALDAAQAPPLSDQTRRRGGPYRARGGCGRT